MNKRVSIPVAILVFVILGWRAFHPPEPVYQGKSLSVWLEDYEHPFDDIPDSQLDAERRASNQALLQIGINAIPFLVDWIRAKDSPLKVKWMKFADDHHLEYFHFTPAQVARGRALGAFKVLGTNAWPAIPALHQLLSNPETARAAGFALVYIKAPETARMIDQLSKEPDARVREAAVYISEVYLSQQSKKAGVAKTLVPILMKSLKDSDQGVRLSAVDLSGKFSSEKNTVVPILKQLLQDPDPQIRLSAGFSLDKINENTSAEEN